LRTTKIPKHKAESRKARGLDLLSSAAYHDHDRDRDIAIAIALLKEQPATSDIAMILQTANANSKLQPAEEAKVKGPVRCALCGLWPTVNPNEE
jgi:hypothetical protein